MNNIILSVGILGSLGILFALILSYASNVFHVKVDRRIEAIRSELPGANCGACGFPGCDGLAAAIINNGAPINSCPVGGAPLVETLADLLGLNAELTSREVAVVLCQGDKDTAKEKFEYIGIRDCRANNAIQGGNKSCSTGCLGCGTCVDVCQFDSIHIVNGVALVDKDKCTACKKCIEVCPKKIISLVDYEQEVVVKCSSKDAGKIVRGNCSVGCIGCKICVKQCPDGFVVENNLARFTNSEGIDMELVENAINKCPTKCIHPGLERKRAEQSKSSDEQEQKVS